MALLRLLAVFSVYFVVFRVGRTVLLISASASSDSSSLSVPTARHHSFPIPPSTNTNTMSKRRRALYQWKNQKQLAPNLAKRSIPDGMSEDDGFNNTTANTTTTPYINYNNNSNALNSSSSSTLPPLPSSVPASPPVSPVAPLSVPLPPSPPPPQAPSVNNIVVNPAAAPSPPSTPSSPSSNVTLDTVMNMLQITAKNQRQTQQRLDDINESLHSLEMLADSFDDAYTLLMNEVDQVACNTDERVYGLDNNRRCYFIDGQLFKATYDESVRACAARKSTLMQTVDVPILKNLLPQKSISSVWLNTPAPAKGFSFGRKNSNSATVLTSCSVFALNGTAATTQACSQVSGYVCSRPAVGKVTLGESMYNLLHNIKSGASFRA